MDLYEQVSQLEKQVSDLKKVIDAMRAEATIPFDIREAFKASLGSSITAQAATSTTYTKSVNEAGTGTYNVSRVMDGIIPVILNGQIYYIPYYN